MTTTSSAPAAAPAPSRFIGYPFRVPASRGVPEQTGVAFVLQEDTELRAAAPPLTNEERPMLVGWLARTGYQIVEAKWGFAVLAIDISGDDDIPGDDYIAEMLACVNEFYASDEIRKYCPTLPATPSIKLSSTAGTGNTPVRVVLYEVKPGHSVYLGYAGGQSGDSLSRAAQAAFDNTEDQRPVVGATSGAVTIVQAAGGSELLALARRVMDQLDSQAAKPTPATVGGRPAPPQYFLLLPAAGQPTVTAPVATAAS